MLQSKSIITSTAFLFFNLDYLQGSELLIIFFSEDVKRENSHLDFDKLLLTQWNHSIFGVKGIFLLFSPNDHTCWKTQNIKDDIKL